MERYDYSNLLNAISNIKTENEVALNDRLASRKNKLAKLTNKVEQSGILEDWCNLQQTCRKLDIRLLPLRWTDNYGKIRILKEFEEEYEKYRDFQLKRIYAVMDRLTEKTEKIKSEI